MIPKITIALIGDKGTHKKEIIRHWLSLGPGMIEDNGQYSKIFWLENKPFMLIIHKQRQAIPGIYDGIVYICKGIDDIKTVQLNMRHNSDTMAYQCTIMLGLNPSTTLFHRDLYSTILEGEQLQGILNQITIKVFVASKIVFNTRETVIPWREPIVLEDYYVPIDEIDRDCCYLL